MNPCESCNGNGWVESNDQNDNDEIQKCDDCNLYETYEQARESSWLRGIGSWTKKGYSGDY